MERRRGYHCKQTKLRLYFNSSCREYYCEHQWIQPAGAKLSTWKIVVTVNTINWQTVTVNTINWPKLSTWVTVHTINWPTIVSVNDCEHNQLTQNCQREWLWTQPTHTNCQLAWLWTQSTHTNCQREWLWTQLTDPNCQLQKVSLLWTQLAARNGQLLGTVSWPKHSSCQVQKEMLLWTQLADQNCQLQQEPWLNISWGEGTGGGVLTWFSLFFSPCPGPLLSLNKVSGTFGAIMSIGHYNKRRYGSRLSLSSVGKWPKPFRQCAAFLGLTSNMTASVSWDLRSLANTPQSCED